MAFFYIGGQRHTDTHEHDEWMIRSKWLEWVLLVFLLLVTKLNILLHFNPKLISWCLFILYYYKYIIEHLIGKVIADYTLSQDIVDSTFCLITRYL